MFFWQASEEVEEEKAAGQNTLAKRRRATLKELGLRNIDVGVGTFFSNVVMFFIILTTAITLNRQGITHIETTRQAAEALRPLAGKFAATLFTAGIVGVGFLAIPTLAGSTAYAFAETLGWHQGLNKKLKQARAFYALILLSTGVGVGLDSAGINPVKALYWTAVIDGLLAPFLLVAILVVASDKALMQGQPSSRLGWTVVAITTVAMFAAGVAMFVVSIANLAAVEPSDRRMASSTVLDLALRCLHQLENNLRYGILAKLTVTTYPTNQTGIKREGEVEESAGEKALVGQFKSQFASFFGRCTQVEQGRMTSV